MLLGPITHRLSIAALAAVTAYLFALGVVGPQHARVHFGVWMPEGSGEVLVDAEVAPLIEGVRFGWLLSLPADGQTHEVREELILPSAPETWIVGPDTTLSADRTIATTVRQLRGDRHWTDHTWRILEGDPPGRYLVRVYVDGRLVLQDSLIFEPQPVLTRVLNR